MLVLVDTYFKSKFIIPVNLIHFFAVGECRAVAVLMCNAHLIESVTKYKPYLLLICFASFSYLLWVDNQAFQCQYVRFSWVL